MNKMILLTTFMLLSNCTRDIQTQSFDSKQRYLQTVQALHSYLEFNCEQLTNDTILGVKAVYHVLLIENFPIYESHLTAEELAIIKTCEQQYQSCLTGILSN